MRAVRLAPLILAFLLIPAESTAAPDRPSPFRGGESLKFQFRWLGMAIATVRLTAEGPLPWEDKQVFRLRGRLRSAGLLRRLIRVDDKIVSFAEPGTLFSHRIETRQKEGGYRGKRWNVFKNGRATYGRPKRPPRYYEIEGRVHDLLSGIYQARSLGLRSGTSATINVFHNKKLYPVRLQTLATETIETLWGPLRVLVIRPEFIGNAYLNGLATSWIYFTAGRHRISVRIESKTKLGPLVAHLIESQGVPSGPLAKSPIRKPKGWRPAARRLKKVPGGGLSELKKILNKSGLKSDKK